VTGGEDSRAGLLAGGQHPAHTKEQKLMELSARNQLEGTVKGVKSGAVMAEITVEVKPGSVTAAITDASRDRLHLKEGDTVSVIIKATEVMLATP
jgi:molybdopterin-binding protein